MSGAPGTKSPWQDVPLFAGAGLLIGVAGAYLGGGAMGFNPGGLVMGGLTALGVVLVGLHLFLSLNRHAFVGGAENVILSVVFVGLMAVLYLFLDRNPKRWDFVNTWYDLSSQTQTVFKDLKEPVELILVFPPSSYQRNSVLRLLERLKATNPDKVKVLIRDPNDPGLSRNYNIETPDPNGQVLINIRKKTKVVGFSELFVSAPDGSGANFDGEGAILRAVLGIQSQKSTEFCFLSQHGQPPVMGRDAPLGSVKAALEGDLYTVRPINLIRESRVPDGCDVVVEAGGKTDLSEMENAALLDYWKRGGRLLVAFNETPAKLPQWKALLAVWGLKPVEGVIIAENIINANTNERVPLVLAKPMPHAATQVLVDFGYEPEMPVTFGLKAIEPQPRGLLITPVLKTGADVYTDKAMEIEAPRFTAGEDGKGPFEVGFAVKSDVNRKDRLNKDARVLALGNALWMDRTVFERSAPNRELLLRSAAWLVGSEIKVKAAPKPLGQNTVSLLPGQHALVNLVVFLLLPGFMVAMALSTAARNRAR